MDEYSPETRHTTTISVVETITGVTGTVVVMTSSILIIHIIGVDIAGDGVGSSSIFDGSCRLSKSSRQRVSSNFFSRSRLFLASTDVP